MNWIPVADEKRTRYAEPHGELDEGGVRTVYQILARGGVMLMFPEGRYSRGRAIRTWSPTASPIC